MKYYSLEPILHQKARYNVIVGMRSNGKTYSALKYALEQYISTGSEIAYVRRYREDFIGKRGDQLFAALVENEEISKITNGEWTGVIYRAKRWYLSRIDEKGDVYRSTDPFCYGFSLTEMEHDKSVSYPNIRNVIFDEFITRQYYLNDEFVIFCNLLSTIIRDRDNVTIFMLGNTVNKFCPYFKEMGLRHVNDMKPGTIELYKTVQNLKIAVEYCALEKDRSTIAKPSDIYFSFDNPKLEMITGGTWELDIYPHLPIKYTPSDILFTYFIDFDSQLLQCEIIAPNIENGYPVIFTYIHAKTTPLKHPERDIIFTTTPHAEPNYFRNLLSPIGDIDRKISKFFKSYKVFYQDNEIGEVVKNYMKVCQKEGLLS